MPQSTTHNTGNIFTITLTLNQNEKKHIYSRPPHQETITTITLYFSTRRQHLSCCCYKTILLLLLTMMMLNKRTLLFLCCIAIGAATIAVATQSRPRTPPPGAQPSQQQSKKRGYKDSHLYPLKTFFIRTSDVEANKMSHKLLQGGSYHDFLEVHQIRSRACYGWNVVLKVTTDDTHFFNSKTAVWPTRPEFEWIASALNNDLSSIYYIHYLTYTVPPNMEAGEGKGELALNDLYCDTTSISVDLRDINRDDDDDDDNNDKNN